MRIGLDEIRQRQQPPVQKKQPESPKNNLPPPPRFDAPSPPKGEPSGKPGVVPGNPSQQPPAQNNLFKPPADAPSPQAPNHPIQMMNPAAPQLDMIV